ncbi:MAG: 16S rRNA (adenine(1518)-N(6)/adenine(1519)-N(6))-dimethyltransferase RsmA [Dehalococcoidia bacterium]|nr:16S rRNA (adenine(1518)-N(6)/adenine(1519)-N(6))-dimethyltransferase RsmA [Dehalococcoidia bacterium]
MSSTEDPEEAPPAPAVPLSHLKRAKSLLRNLGKRPFKGLGQHFLVDAGVLGKIVDEAHLSARDVVVEVGPGLGILTQELAQRVSRVIAVEVDASLARLLRETLSGFQNVTIVQADILETNPGELVREGTGDQERAKGTGEEGVPPEYKVVANLPYNIASPVLRHFLEDAVKPRVMLVMVQLEVARRMTAKPGHMSPLAVGIQMYGHPTIVHMVSPQSFFPPPKVYSAIVRIKVYPKPAVDADPAAFFRVVRAGFSQPRKQLRNSLAAGLSLKPVEAVSVLSRAGVDPERRAQTLSLEEWDAATASSLDFLSRQETSSPKQ